MDVSGLCLQRTTITRWDCFHLLANVILFQELTRNFHPDLMTCSEERAEAARVRACLLLLNPHLLLSPELFLSPKLCLSSCLLLLDTELKEDVTEVDCCCLRAFCTAVVMLGLRMEDMLPWLEELEESIEATVDSICPLRAARTCCNLLNITVVLNPIFQGLRPFQAFGREGK